MALTATDLFNDATTREIGGVGPNQVNLIVSDLVGIFEARFDNELLGKDSTGGADVAAMIQGLHTGNAALVTAAAERFHANAADVSGNNVPLNGGTFNANSLTVADALSTATAPLPPAPVTPLTPATPVTTPVPAVAAPATAAPSRLQRRRRLIAPTTTRRRGARSIISIWACPKWQVNFTTSGHSGARRDFLRPLQGTLEAGAGSKTISMAVF